jgi:hypothetical protein
MSCAVPGPPDVEPPSRGISRYTAFAFVKSAAVGAEGSFEQLLNGISTRESVSSLVSDVSQRLTPPKMSRTTIRTVMGVVNA